MKKVLGLKAISEWLIEEIKKIENENITLGRKNQKIKRACDKAKKNLWIKVDMSKPDGNQDLIPQEKGFINESTYKSYLTRLRRRINEAGIKSLTLDNDFEKLLVDCKPLSRQLKKVDKTTAITIRLTMKPVKDLIKKAGWWKSFKITEKQSKKIEKCILAFSGDNKAAMEQLTTDAIMKERTNERVKRRKIKTETLKEDRKLSIIKVIELANALLNARSWELLTIGLGFATGRRASEILHFGQFSESGKLNLKFKGQRKNRVKANEESKIPSIVNPSLVVEAVKRLRDMPEVKEFKRDFNGISEAEQALKLNNRSHAKLCARTDELMKDIYEQMKVDYLEWVFKDTRSAYAHTALSMLEAREINAGREFKYKGAKLGKYYFQKVLLHSNDETSEMYEAFTILEPKTELKRYHIDKARGRGEKSYFKDRLELLKEWLKSNDRPAFEKYITWCISAIKKDPSISINNTILRRECKGRVTIVSEFVRELVERRLNLVDLILVIPEEKEPKITTKQISVTYTVTIEQEIEVEIIEGEKESEAIDAAVNERFDDLSLDDGYMDYDIQLIDFD